MRISALLGAITPVCCQIRLLVLTFEQYESLTFLYVGDCIETFVIFEEEAIFDKLQVLCDASGSCSKMKVSIDNKTSLDTGEILCNAQFACNDMFILIDNMQCMKINVECNETWSCYGLSIDIKNGYDTNQTELFVNISCYFVSACTDMIITTRNGIYTFITLNIYQYSENV